jgi:MoaA/NifB/PqqE/SkfB family radical SAM enzyme
MIERDYNFFNSLIYNTNTSHGGVMFEVSDRCNVECPHCYHMPDNTIADKSIEQLINELKECYIDGTSLCMSGAEATLHKDFVELISQLSLTFPESDIFVLTNGIRLADLEYFAECKQAGLDGTMFGLNHPSYLNNPAIRKKQLQGIANAHTLGMQMNYIGYTMSSLSELTDILDETTSSGWSPNMYRVRYGSDIGRYPNQERMYVSDIFNIVKQWCKDNNKRFEILDFDNNIYHVMVSIDDVPYRLIQWCDETDIHMEQLRTGPYCNFVPDGVTNFLHQVIRRDIWKNKGVALPDVPPVRYQITGTGNTEPLDFAKLYV